MILGSDEVKGYLRNNFGYDPQNAPIFADPEVPLPTAEWFFGAYAEEVLRVWKGLKPPFWKRWFIPNKWDCDDFSRGAAWIAAVMHRGKYAGSGHVAEFWYYRNGEPDDEHAIILAMFSPTSIGFMEPQNGRQVYLEPNELCTWYRF